MSALKVEGLRKKFRRSLFSETEVLKGIHFSIPQGSITGFLGGNGSGKTTTMKCVLNLLRADEGKVSFFGDQTLSATISSIGFLPENAYFYDYLTGSEFLSFYGELSGLSRKDIKIRARQLLEQLGLFFAKDRKLRFYSKGMLQKIGLAQALIHRPRLVILDEPMSGLDPDARHTVSEILRMTAKDGASIFFSSHLLFDAERLCDRLVVLKDGKTYFEGTLDKFSALSPGKELEELFVQKVLRS